MYLSTHDPLHLSKNGQNIRIIRMNGGLGNQTFQYIFARWLEIKTGEPCYIDDFHFVNFPPPNIEQGLHNGYELERVFGVKPHLLSRHVSPKQKEEMFWYYQKGVSLPDILLSMGYPLSLIAETSNFSFRGNVSWTPANMYNPLLMNTRGCTYIHGYFINVNWFKDIIGQMLRELTFIPIPDEKNQELARQIMETNSVAVHFRKREIFATEWQTPDGDVARAIELFEKWRVDNNGEEFTYFIFTDNPDYVREHWDDAGLSGRRTVFVEGNTNPNNYIDCQLMALCKHRIVTNSSFDYLAALIRKHRDGLIVNLCPPREIV